MTEVQPVAGSDDTSDAIPSARAVAAEANRRITELGWPVVAETDPAAPGEVRIRPLTRAPGAAAGESDVVAIPLTSTDPDESVSRILAEARRQGWDRSALTTMRLARSSIWCEPI